MTPANPLRFEDGPAMLLAGLRRMHPHSEAPVRIPGQWADFRALGPVPGQLGSRRYGVICGADAGGFEYLAGVEVASFDGLPAGLGRLRIQPQHYAVFLHSGPIGGIAGTWAGIFAWLAESAFSSAEKPDFEVYDERYDAAAARGEVEIRLAVVPRSVVSDARV